MLPAEALDAYYPEAPAADDGPASHGTMAPSQPGRRGMTTPGPAVPPGRAGRLWLQRRLETARRGAGLLDRKLRILQAELDQARESAAQTAAEWRHRQAEARSLAAAGGAARRPARDQAG